MNEYHKTVINPIHKRDIIATINIAVFSPALNVTKIITIKPSETLEANTTLKASEALDSVVQPVRSPSEVLDSVVQKVCTEFCLHFRFMKLLDWNVQVLCCYTGDVHDHGNNEIIPGKVYKDVISDFKMIQDQERMYIGDLVETSYVQICNHVTGNIGPRRSVMSIAANNSTNEFLQQSIEKLSTTHGSFLKILGDGNCYYRSIIVGVIQYNIVKCKWNNFQRLHDVFVSLSTDKYCSAYEIQIKHVCYLLQLAANGEAWQTVDSFNVDILDANNNVDRSLIICCKLLVVNTLITIQNNIRIDNMTVLDMVKDPNNGYHFE